MTAARRTVCRAFVQRQVLGEEGGCIQQLALLCNQFYSKAFMWSAEITQYSVGSGAS